jgi:putative chitinase
MLTLMTLKSLYPNAPAANRRHFAGQAPDLLARFAIVAHPLRLAFFLAQIGHESSGLQIQHENLDYSNERLRQVWPSRFRSAASAAHYVGKPEALANLVYGGRLGNVEPGDGYRFRGRGYIQLTGRDAYREVGKRTNLPLEDRPDIALDVAYALHIACGFWAWKNLNPVCDGGDFVAVTKRINGGTIGLEDRLRWLARVRQVLGATDASAAIANGIPTSAHG